jgi:hypothetical protein
MGVRIGTFNWPKLLFYLPISGLDGNFKLNEGRRRLNLLKAQPTA